MIKKIFFLLSLCLVSVSPSLNADPDILFLMPSKLIDCGYSSPTNFHIVERGETHITVTWLSGGNPPPAYNLKTYLVSTGTLVNNVTIPNSVNGWTVNNLIPGQTYRFELRNVDDQGNICNDPPAIATGSTLILEIIITQYIPSGSSDYCTINQPNGLCSFPSSGVSRFQVRMANKQSYFRDFGIAKIQDSLYYLYVLQSDEQNPPSGYTFECLGGGHAPCTSVGGVAIKFNYTGNPIAVVGVVEYPNVQYPPALKAESLVSGYEITKRTSGMKGNSNDRDINSGFFDVSNSKLSASPNPFTNKLEVTIPFLTEGEKVTMSLFDLQGQLAFQQEVTAQSPIQYLSTENLPQGMYVLRVMAGDHVESIRVVKTQ